MAFVEQDGGSFALGRLLRERRLAQGLTQEQAAHLAGVSVGAWRSTESGRRRPRPQTFAAILHTLELSLDDVRRIPVAYLDDVEQARDELVRRCRDELPAHEVDLVLRVVDLAIGIETQVGTARGADE